MIAPKQATAALTEGGRAPSEAAESLTHSAFATKAFLFDENKISQTEMDRISGRARLLESKCRGARQCNRACESNSAAPRPGTSFLNWAQNKSKIRIFSRTVSSLSHIQIILRAACCFRSSKLTRSRNGKGAIWLVSVSGSNAAILRSRRAPRRPP